MEISANANRTTGVTQAVIDWRPSPERTVLTIGSPFKIPRHAVGKSRKSKTPKAAILRDSERHEAGTNPGLRPGCYSAFARVGTAGHFTSLADDLPASCRQLPCQVIAVLAAEQGWARLHQLPRIGKWAKSATQLEGYLVHGLANSTPTDAKSPR